VGSGSTAPDRQVPLTVQPTGNPQLDGVDLGAVFREPERTFERPLFWRILREGRNQWAARIGRWKYIDDNTGDRGLPELLFDLENDPGERTNLYYRHQDKARELRAQLKAWEKDVEAGG